MLWVWVGFVAFVLVMLGLDLGVAHRREHAVRAREAIGWTSLCVALALAFAAIVYAIYEHQWLGFGTGAGAPKDGLDAAKKYLLGWMVEYALSVDNLFIFSVIFTYFRVPPAHQHRVLFWGILGALVMRGAMIAGGAALIHHFHWTIYIFGGLLIITAVRLLFTNPETVDPSKNIVLRSARRFFPFTPSYHGSRFLIREGGRLIGTPLLLVLLVVEATDVVFAVDSIPAIFAITTDPFLVFTSNVFAILGLRSLYFALAAVIDRFRYLKPSLVVMLAYIGVKMLLSEVAPIPTDVSLAVVGGVLSVGIAASILATSIEKRREIRPDTDQRRRRPPPADRADSRD